MVQLRGETQMDNDRILLSVKRYKQHPSECAVAAISSVANFYDANLDYSKVREMLTEEQKSEGLYTSEAARLLNKLGFSRVSVVTADLCMVDFSWANFNSAKLLEKLALMIQFYKKRKDKMNVDYVQDMVSWLEAKDCENQLIIDNDWQKYIRRHLNIGRPVVASLNWTSTFKRKKSSDAANPDITGASEEHAVVVRGYDNKGVFVVDSHHQCYTGRLTKYHKGYYKLPWSKFLTNIASGDLILVS
jgi:ABC-type bacteriocin/lantibiotic exporter with double-glycine peptidase domain